MAQPQYTYDPVTQTYTRIDAPEQKKGLGALYEAGDGGDGPAPSGPDFGMLSPGMAEVGVGFQNVGQTLSSVPGIATGIGGAISTGIGNSMMNSQVSPVANPVAPTETAISPTTGLAAMNAQTAANNQAVAQQAAVANTAEDVAAAVAGFADTTDAEAGAANAAAASGADGGPSGDAGVSGAANEGSHGADGNNSGADGTGGPDGDSGSAGDSSDDSYYRGGQIMNYSQGGISAARKTEGMGRGDDTMLVHMTPNEVRGLQAIAMAHGGSLTINPRTGLVEAGFLDSILPMVAGAALSAAFPAAAPWMIGLGVGGGATLMTGSLEKGLMAGLGAFGGAGLGTAFSAAGSTLPATTTAGQAMTPGLSQAAAVAPQAATAAPTGLQAALPGMGVQTAATTPMASLAPAGSSAALQTAAAGAPQGFAANMSQMGTGVSNVFQGTPGAREAFMQSAGGPMGLAAKAAPVAGAMFSAEEPKEAGKKPQEYIRPYSFDFKPTTESDPNFKFRTGKRGESTAEQRYFTPTFTPMGVFKSGTEPGGSFYGTPTQEQYDLYSKPKKAPDDETAQDENNNDQGAATGGLRNGAFVVPADVVSHLGNGSNDAGQKILARGLGARPIKGKGDGMSDSIPTTIEGKQPARVADGEAYISPEMVKKVGAKRLYAMMDKIRQARTGTKKQAPEVDPRKFLPA